MASLVKYHWFSFCKYLRSAEQRVEGILPKIITCEDNLLWKRQWKIYALDFGPGGFKPLAVKDWEETT